MKVSNLSKFLKNPSITKFNLISHFIYDLAEYNIYLNSVNNVDLIKSNQLHIDKNKSIINDIYFSKDAQRELYSLKSLQIFIKDF